MELNFAFWLSLVLAAMGCAGLLLAGRGHWYGWGIGLAVQPVWATYAIITEGYGLLITCLMYGFVNAKNLLKWREDNKTKAVSPDPIGRVSSMRIDEHGLIVKVDLHHENRT